MDQVRGIHDGGKDTNFEENTNQSEKEREKAEGGIEIVGDTEAGPDDETEDKDELEDDLPEDMPA